MTNGDLKGFSSRRSGRSRSASAQCRRSPPSRQDHRRSHSHSNDRRHPRRRTSRSGSRSASISRSLRGNRRGYASDASSASNTSGRRSKHHDRKRKKHKDKNDKKDKKKSKKSYRRSEPASPARPTYTESDAPHRSIENAPLEPVTAQAAPTITKNNDAKSFFARLQQQESTKETVGTIHASGMAASTAAATAAADQWECSKAGCGHKNFKHAGACNKCGAMKRMSEWR